MKSRKLRRAISFRLQALFLEDLQDKEQVHSKPTVHRLEKTALYLLLVFIISFIFYFAYEDISAQLKKVGNGDEEYIRLQEAIQAAELENEELQQTNEELSKRIVLARNETMNRLDASIDENKKVLEEYRAVTMIAGATQIKGPGVRVVMRDKEGILYNQSTLRSEIIHDADIRFVVDWFKRAEIAAIQVNGERLTAMSPLICMGPSIRVNRIFHATPFVIEVCSPNEELAQLFENSELVKRLKERGLRIEIEKIDEFTVNALDDLRYIKDQVNALGGNYED